MGEGGRRQGGVEGGKQGGDKGVTKGALGMLVLLKLFSFVSLFCI